MRIHTTGSTAVLSALLVLFAAACLTAAETTAPSPADTLFDQAASMLEHGDTTMAEAALDRALELDPHHCEARLARGRIALHHGDLGEAERHFNYVRYSGSPQVRSRAWVGLGDVQASYPKRHWQAIGDYRIAIMVDPGNNEARLKAAHAALAIGTPDSYAAASEFMAELICLDPSYHDIYQVWDDTILIKKDDAVRTVCACLESYIKEHQGVDSLLLEVAEQRFMLDEYDECLAVLDRLEKALPEYRPVDRYLLRARCLVELEEIEEFQAAYDSALAVAGRTGDFEKLVSQAAAIFRPEEERKADTLTTAEQWTEFFRIFWLRRDTDPLTPVNERLFEHYRRLKDAEEKYAINNPYSKIWKSRDRYRHSSQLAEMHIYNNSGLPNYQEYDPDLFFRRNRDLLLGQRGLLYVRHGQPDEIEIPYDDYILPMSGPMPEEEIWRYGSTYFVFSPGRMGGADGIPFGEYFFVPFSIKGSANIEKAMETESFFDPLPELEQDFYLVDFLAPDGENELEAYQSLPLEQYDTEDAPAVDLVVFDSKWKEMVRDTSAAFRVLDSGKIKWFGMNRVRLEPGQRIFAARMEIPGKRVVQRQIFELYPFSPGSLDLSGVVLGIPVPPSSGSHSRLGVKLLPRPSLTYTTGEIMTVYLEVYGLKADPGGRRGYTESVTVSRVSEEGIFGKVKRLITPGGVERSSSLTLTFERQPEGAQGTIPETFTVDTSLLLPGEYRMEIEVADGGSDERRQAICAFKLLEPE